MLDYCLASISILFFLLALIVASILDVRTGEVDNWVWTISLLAVPIGVFRIWVSGFLLLYLLQIGLVLALVISCFHVGILGGGDGKAILILSVICPWLEIDLFTVLLAAILVLWGGFLIIGIHSLVLFLRNLLKWHGFPPKSKEGLFLDKKRYWFTRILSCKSISEAAVWKTARVPLIAYLLITYLALFAMKLLI